MKILINVLILAGILGVGYLLVNSIKEPIEFQAEKDKRVEVVVNKLKEIRTAQLAFRGIVGKFAHDFDTLTEVLKNDTFKIIRVFGNPDDEEKKEEVVFETVYVPAIDSVNKLGLNLDSLSFVPYGGGEKFEIKAEVNEFQSTSVPMVLVRTPYKTFMGKFAAPRYKRFDNSYNPDDITEKNYFLQFGSLNKPTTAGSWD